MLNKHLKKLLKRLNFQYFAEWFMRVNAKLINLNVLNKRKLRIHKLMWQIIFAAFFVFILTICNRVYDKVEASINSLFSNSETVNFYSEYCELDPIPSDYTVGWWGAFNTGGKPDLDAAAAASEFNEENSAFYQGGNYNLACKKFVMDNKLQSSDSEQKIIYDSKPFDFAQGRQMTDNGKHIIDDIASTTKYIKIATNTSRIATNTDEVTEFQKGAITPDVEMKSDNQEKETGVEIYYPETPDNEVKVLNEQESGSSTPDNLISWAGKKIKGLFKMIRVQADDSELASNTDYPGVFKAARINFSYASVFSQLATDQTQIATNTGEVRNGKVEAENVDFTQAPQPFGAIEPSEVSEVEIIDARDEVEVEVNERLGGEKQEPIVEIEDEVSMNNYLKEFFTTREAQAGGLPHIVVWYSATTSTNEIWQKLGTIERENLSNAQNSGYFSYDAELIKTWKDIGNVKVKFEGRSSGQTTFITYLDSVWIEAEYENDKAGTNNTLENQNDTLMLLSDKLVFGVDEKGELDFRYKKIKTGLLDLIGESLGLTSYWGDVKINASLVGPDGKRLDLPLTIMFAEDGAFSVSWPEMLRNLRPGKYSLVFNIEDSSGNDLEILELKQDFSWGVLAFNTNKSIYLPGETAYLQMGVLDDRGHTLCDAGLDIEIIAPLGKITKLSTSDHTIVANPECGPNNIINAPDYYAYYQAQDVGVYYLTIIASTTNGTREITDKFEASESVPFDIERIGPTRIYPMADYRMQLKIKANKDFEGEIVDYVPGNFDISEEEILLKKSVSSAYFNYNELVATSSEKAIYKNQQGGGEKLLVWENLKLKAGDEFKISYEFDAPDISPEFYLLGPLEMIVNEGEISESCLQELRQWQIASDLLKDSTSSLGVNSGWDDPGWAWDDGIDTHASRDIIKKTGSGETGSYLESTENKVQNLGGDINQVWVGIEGYRETTDVAVYVIPKFNGTVNGDLITINNLPSAGSDNNTPVYQEITGDTHRLNYPDPWTWQEIEDLNIRMYGGNNNSGQNRMLYIDQIWIRVDYTPNTAPTSTIEAAVQRQNNSGVVDVTMAAYDTDKDYLVARLEFESGANCTFSGSESSATLDEADINTAATYEDVTIDNNFAYRIGSTTADMIKTASGTNYVDFDWLSKTDLNNQEGTYCLQITAYDLDDVQAAPATTTIVVDNKAPATPGNLIASGTTKNTATLKFGSQSTDLNFYEYKIYYATSTPVTEADYLYSSSTDSNLEYSNFFGAATTTIAGLLENTIYYFTIWAYDSYGHVSSSSPTSITTNKAPLSAFNSVSQKTDGSGIVDIEFDAGDLNHEECTVRLEYEAGSGCLFGLSGDPSLDAGSIGSSLGAPYINNAEIYQIREVVTTGTSTVWLDWLSATDEASGDDTYCLRLTANDGKDNQNTPATITFTLDNAAPTEPGALENGGVSTSTVILNYGATTTESNFLYYKIYYSDSAGVTESDTPHNDDDLNDKFFNETANTSITALEPDSDYYFKIWAYDQFGNKASSTETHIKTNATLTNDSFTFINPQSANYAIADGVSEWTFRAVVSEQNGWTTIDNVKLRLADSADYNSPFSDLEFTWIEATNSFSETGTDSLSATTLANSSTSTCAANTCTLDFNLVFSHTFATSSTDYNAELYSTNDGAAFDQDSYINIYQVKIIRIEQIHYRWRNDDGGE